MKSLRASLLGLALLAGSTVSALSADLGDIRQDDESFAESSAARFYLRGDLGYDWNRLASVSEQGTDFSSASMSNGWNYGIGIGWYLAPNWRFDLTAEHHNAGKVDGTIASTNFNGEQSFDVSSQVVLANLYYDFTGRAGFNPYLGVGIGWAETNAHNGITTDACGCVSTIDNATQDNFAWALMAGVTRELDHGFSIDAGYRLLDVGGARTGNIQNSIGQGMTSSVATTGNIYSNEVRIGLRYDIQ